LEGIPIDESGKFVNILEMGYGNTGGRNNQSGGAAVPSDAELLVEYEKERKKAKLRAEKFGIPYTEPPPDAFLKWSEARRLRANPERGFITGIDTFSAEEVAKAKERKERFAREERKRKGLDPEGDNDEGEEDGEEGEEAMDDDVDDVAEWEKTKRDPLPIEQAWENWKLVKQFRVDPPVSLNVNAAASAAAEGGEETKEEFIPRNDAVVPTKIHIFSIDWAPFKQIRTDDLMSYFRDYGPSYVEWLGELSCNVLFEDKHSAARAFRALSQELPSPPPPLPKKEERKEEEGQEAGEAPMEDAEGNATKDEQEDDAVNSDGVGSEEENNSMEDADADANNTSVEKYMEDGMEVNNDASKEEQQQQEQEEEEPLPDYGGMGWRFCKWTVRKVSNDRYGRRGTRARVLMRLATTADVLDDRPTEWPKPPPGFTTKRVLMPWHDFSGRRRHNNRGNNNRRDNKRRRRGGGGRRRSRDDEEEDYAAAGGEHPGLSKGLRSRRSGFSVEELEAERNAKNAEILT